MAVDGGCPDVPTFERWCTPADAGGELLTLILAFSPAGGATEGGPISQEPKSRGQPSGRSESFVYCALIVNLPFLYDHMTQLCEQYACWLHDQKAA
jgi:hypothetical protein